MIREDKVEIEEENNIRNVIEKVEDEKEIIKELMNIKGKEKKKKEDIRLMRKSMVVVEIEGSIKIFRIKKKKRELMDKIEIK